MSSTKRIILTLALSILALLTASTARASTMLGTSNCADWAADQWDVQGDAANELRQGHYAAAAAPLEKASAILPPCDIETHPKDRPALTWVVTKQLLFAAYLGVHSFSKAHQVSNDLWRFGKVALQPDQRKASDYVVTSDFKSAFFLYKANRISWTVDPSISDINGWQSYLSGLSAGSDGRYERARVDFKKAATLGYKETLYLYGVSLVAVGDRCAAYREFKATLIDSYTLTNPVDDLVSWASISAVRAINTLYLEDNGNAQLGIVLNKC